MNPFEIHVKLKTRTKVILAFLPFLLLLLLYASGSASRLRENPGDKLMPGATNMARAFNRMAFEKNERTGSYPLLQDTVSSLRRIGLGLALSAVVGLVLGLNMGVYPRIQAVFLPVVTFLSNVPPLALLPIFLIVFDTGELSKVMLIFAGTVFIIARDIFLSVAAIPAQQTVKSLTLGATPMAVAWRIILPQVFPRLLETLRLCLGSAWLFLIAAEAVAAQSGLGYRIFLVRRFLAMDVILPYVVWITVLAFLMDYILKQIIERKFRWYCA